MNGLALGLRYGNQVNSLNPASYSAIDSLTMIFDVGLSGQITNFKEGNVSRNAKNADFEYAVAAFRVFPKVGLSIGLIPFTNIGYDYTSTSRIGTSETTTAETHTGSGGIHQAFVGVGWNVFSGLSLGANISYLWGSYERQISISSSDAYVNTMERTYGATVNSYKLDFGLQWEQRMAKDDRLTLGATVGIGHKLGADPEVTTTSSNSQTGVSSDNTFTVENGLAIPMSYGVGVAWSHGGKFTVGADYSLQQWGKRRYARDRCKHRQICHEERIAQGPPQGDAWRGVGAKRDEPQPVGSCTLSCRCFVCHALCYHTRHGRTQGV